MKKISELEVETKKMILAKYPEIYNYAIEITPRNKERQ